MIAGPAPNFFLHQRQARNQKTKKQSGTMDLTSARIGQHTSRHMIASKLNTVVVVRVTGVGDHFFVGFDHFQINWHGFAS